MATDDKVVYYLSPNEDKGWKIFKKGGERATKLFSTKKKL